MNENKALEFYERITDGKERSIEITLEHGSNAKLENVEMRPVDKVVLASVIQRLPKEMFEAVEGGDDFEEREEALEESGMSTEVVTRETVEAFEDLCAESLWHDGLTSVQMKKVVSALSFEKLFELGGRIIEMSFERTGDIKDFHEQG